MRLLPKIWLFLGEKKCAPFCAVFGQIMCAFEFRIINISVPDQYQIIRTSVIVIKNLITIFLLRINFSPKKTQACMKIISRALPTSILLYAPSGGQIRYVKRPCLLAFHFLSVFYSAEKFVKSTIWQSRTLLVSKTKINFSRNFF